MAERKDPPKEQSKEQPKPPQPTPPIADPSRVQPIPQHQTTQAMQAQTQPTENPSFRPQHGEQRQNLEPKMEYQGLKVVATRKSRDGDAGYQLNTPYDQVTIILEDGTERVVYSHDLIEASTKNKK
jgi:hypothetical protein